MKQQHTLTYARMLDRRSEPPFAVREGPLVGVISTIRDISFEVSDRVNAVGHACWYVWNGTVERKYVEVTVESFERIAWKPSDPNYDPGQKGIKFCGTVDRCSDSQTQFSYLPHRSAEFKVVSDGAAFVVSKCNLIDEVLESTFIAFCGPGGGDPPMAKIDWLGALAEMAEELPGGRLVLGPILRIREDQRADERNREIDDALRGNRLVSEDVLKNVLELGEHLNQFEQFTLWMTKNLLEQVAKSQIDNIPRPKVEQALRQLPEVSKFPLLIPKKILIQELNELYSSIDGIRDILLLEEYPVPASTGKVQFIHDFVFEMGGKDRGLLLSVFKRLQNKDTASDVLNWAVEYLSRYVARSS